MIETSEQAAKKYICPDLSTPDADVYCIGAQCIHYLELLPPLPPAPPGYPQPRPFACAKGR